MQLRVLFTQTQGHQENIGFHHIYNSLAEVRASTHESVCDSGCGPKKYLNECCYWKSTEVLLSAKKVIIICFRIFLLTRCLAPKPWPRPQWSPVWRPWFFSRFPGKLCHKIANIFHYDMGLPLDPTGGNICTRAILQRADKQNYPRKPTTLAKDGVFLHPSWGRRQSQSRDIMLHLGYKQTEHKSLH